ncbi:MAG: heat-inducible transcriptional repressor HrcA [Nitrospirota bacterium]
MLSERNRKILCAIVQSYINFPGPVGSRAVTKRYSFGLSPATIRNIMADLEEMGFLTQPHTSAGRVPTDLGYRFYVDSLVTEGEYYPNIEILQEICKKLETVKSDIDMLLRETTLSLSLMSHYLGVAMTSRPAMATLKRINLLKFAERRIVAILFTDEGLLKNRMISLDFDISQRDLDRITNYLNAEFSGLTVDEVRFRILTEMSREKTKCERLIAHAVKICQEAINLPHSDLFVSGLSEVLDLPDFADLKKIKELSRAIEDKHTIMKLLDKLSESDGVQVIIGSENLIDELKRLSIVVSSCKEGDRMIGVVGIIGPTRMNYARAIYVVKNMAKFITGILAEK